MTIDQPLSIRAVLGFTLTLILRHPLGIVLGAASTTFVNTGLDLWAPQASPGLVTSTVSTGVIYFVSRWLLHQEGLIEREGRFWPCFVASLLVSLGVIAGFVLLIVPGLYLMARWSLCTALVITRDMRAIASLRASWQATKPYAWKLVLLFTIYLMVFFGTVMLVGGIAGALVFMLSGSANAIETSVPVILGIDLAANTGVIAGAYLTVAIYRQVIRSDAGVEAVFV